MEYKVMETSGRSMLKYLFPLSGGCRRSSFSLDIDPPRNRHRLLFRIEERELWIRFFRL